MLAIAQGGTTPAADAPAATGGVSSTEQRLRRLEEHQLELERQLQKKDAEIQDLKKQVNGTPKQGSPAAAAQPSASEPAPSTKPLDGQNAAATGTASTAAAAAPTAAAAATAAGSAAAAAPPPQWGNYTDFLGFKVANTSRGDMNVAIYTYVRYLNQLATNASYTNYFGQTSTLQRRQEAQILKVQIKFLGWILSPNLRYFLYAWSSNANQGLGAQVVLAGNLNYTFNKYATLSGGITSLPGVRSTEGNFPFWLNVDNRMMADEFMRPSYTSGFWLKGEIAPGLRYQAMIGNNLSTLGVSSAQLNNHLDTLATALVWTPLGEFGQGFGDFEDHQSVVTRLGAHYTHSKEDKQSQPNTDAFENTQIRLADGSVIFTPNLFGPGINIDEVRYQMSTVDAGIKYRGMALEGEFYWRRLDQFHGDNTASLPNLYDRGFQLQASMMAIPRTLQFYLAGSRVDGGKYGQPWDTRFGVNFFPWKNRVFRWNTQVMYINRSPVGYTSLTYNVGSTGWIFNTDFELAL